MKVKILERCKHSREINECYQTDSAATASFSASVVVECWLSNTLALKGKLSVFKKKNAYKHTMLVWTDSLLDLSILKTAGPALISLKLLKAVKQKVFE